MFYFDITQHYASEESLITICSAETYRSHTLQNELKLHMKA